MKILITGSNGQVGRELVRQATMHQFDIVGVDIDDVDITDSKAVDGAITEKDVSLVINTAAYIAVDKAEKEPDLAFSVNKHGSTNLAIACCDANIPLIHISTDYVFNGTKTGAYIESDPMNPLGAYSRSKAEGEEEVRKHLKQHIILRTAWLYSIHGANFLKTILKLSRERDEIQVVDDQSGCPTSAVDVAETVLLIAKRILLRKHVAWGTYHYCCLGRGTWYDLAHEIIKVAGKYESLRLKKITPIPTKAYPTIAKRPLNSMLDCTKISQAFRIHPKPWKSRVAETITQLYAQNSTCS